MQELIVFPFKGRMKDYRYFLALANLSSAYYTEMQNSYDGLQSSHEYYKSKAISATPGDNGK